MNSIIGLTYLTREYVNNEKQVLENLDKISQSARFMLSFVDDILNLSQIPRRQRRIEQPEGGLRRLLETVEEAMRQAAERRVHFAVDRRGSFDALPIALTRRSWAGAFQYSGECRKIHDAGRKG